MLPFNPRLLRQREGCFHTALRLKVRQNPLFRGSPGTKLRCLRFVVFVILCFDMKRFSFDPQIDIFTYQNNLPGGVFVPQVLSNCQNTVIRNILPERCFELFGVCLPSSM